MSVLAFYFGIPHGAIWSNLLAEPLCVALAGIGAYLFRNKLMRRFVAFHHRHKTEHAARLEDSS